MENTSNIRTLLGTLAGIIVGFVIVLACQRIGSFIEPEAFDLDTEEVLIPLSLTIATFIGWLVGAFGGSWLAARTTGKALTGWVVCGALIGAAVYMALAIGDAWWVLAAGIVIPLIGGGLGTRVANVG
jgi:hypothetical protein